MKIPSFIKSFPPLQIVLFVIFIVYVIFPFSMPPFIATMVDSPLGMIAIFCITIFLFIYANPILAITYIFVAYELLRRSSIVTGKTVIYANAGDSSVVYPSISGKIDNKVISETNVQTQNANIYAVSLEEEIILKRKIENFEANAEKKTNENSSYKPVSSSPNANFSPISLL